MKKLKRIFPYIINIVLVLSIFILALIITKTYPFGNILLGRSDVILEYKPILYNFIMSLKTHTLSSYSFNNGLGNPVIFNFIYYLSSPLNLIALPFNNPDYMYLSIIIFKLTLSAITITFYAKKKTNNNFISTIICLSYVFSSWFLCYYSSISWLDIFLIFPLLQYGLERLLNDHKFNLYIFTLAFTFMTNFYLAFSIIIYILLYFIIIKLIYEKNSIKDKLNSFNYLFISTLVSLLLSSFYIYIVFITYLRSGAFNTITNNYTLSIMDFIKALFYGNINITMETEGFTYPNIALNTIMLISFFYYFINTKISIKEKILSLCITLLTIAFFFIPTLDHLMNLFQNINGYTYRYTFIPIFLVIILFIRNINSFNPKDLKKIYFIIPIILILLLINYKNIEFNIFVFNIVFILSYLVLIKFYNKSKLYKTLIILMLFTESALALSFNISSNINKNDIDTDNINFKTESIPYRINTLGTNEYINKNLYTNDNVTYLLSSMTYNHIINLSYKLGCSTYANSQILCSNDNELFNMLFNIKNDYYLEKIYSVNSDILLISLDEYNIKNSYEYLIESMTGIKDIYDTLEITGLIEDDHYRYYIDKNLYFIDLETNGYLINIPQTYQEFTSSNESFTIYTPNEDKLKEIYNTLKQNQIKYTSYSDNKIEGTINVDNNQIIFTSIPYDSSWEVKIDGKKINPIIVLDSLLGIECEEGIHTITLEYKNNFITPVIISITTLIGILIFSFKKKKI